MARKKTPKQQLVALYEMMLKEYLQKMYVVHCTASAQVYDAANKALQEDYKERMRLFNEKLDAITNPLEERIESLKWECMEASMGEDF